MKDLAKPLIKLIEEVDENSDESVLQFAKESYMLFAEKYNPLFLQAHNAIRGGKEKKDLTELTGLELQPARLALILSYLEGDQVKGKALSEKLNNKVWGLIIKNPSLENELTHVGALEGSFEIALREYSSNLPKEKGDELLNLVEKISEVKEECEILLEVNERFKETDLDKMSIRNLRQLHAQLSEEVDAAVLAKIEGELKGENNQLKQAADSTIKKAYGIAVAERKRLEEISAKDKRGEGLHYFSESYKSSREELKPPFDVFIGGFDAIRKDAEDAFKIPPRENLTNAEYCILLRKYWDERNAKIELLGEKLTTAATTLSEKLDDIQPHRERAIGLDTLIIKGLVALFEGLHHICSSIPKVPDFLKTKSQDKVEEIKSEAHKFKKPGG